MPMGKIDGSGLSCYYSKRSTIKMHLEQLIAVAELYCEACLKASQNRVERYCLDSQIDVLRKVRSVDDICKLSKDAYFQSCFLITQVKLRDFLEHLDLTLIGKREVMMILSVLEEVKADTIAYESLHLCEDSIYEQAEKLQCKYSAKASAYKAEAIDVAMSNFADLRGKSEAVAIKTAGATLDAYHRAQTSIKVETIKAIETTEAATKPASLVEASPVQSKEYKYIDAAYATVYLSETASAEEKRTAQKLLTTVREHARSKAITA
jgi:hypothetical protein